MIMDCDYIVQQKLKSQYTTGQVDVLATSRQKLTRSVVSCDPKCYRGRLVGVTFGTRCMWLFTN